MQGPFYIVTNKTTRGDIKRNKNSHLLKVDRARSTGTRIDNSLPKYLSSPIVKQKPIRDVDFQKSNEILNNNRALLDRLANISQGKYSIRRKLRDVPKPCSTFEFHKKRRLQRIASENVIVAKKISRRGPEIS